MGQRLFLGWHASLTKGPAHNTTRGWKLNRRRWPMAKALARMGVGVGAGAGVGVGVGVGVEPGLVVVVVVGVHGKRRE